MNVGAPGTSFPTPIAERAKAVLEVFDTVLRTLTDDDDRRRPVLDNLSRFRIWAGNIGAHHVNSPSVDIRLQDAPEVAQRLLELLDELKEANEEIHAIISGERQDAAYEECGDSNMTGSETEPSELGELCLWGSDIITSLLKTSALLQKVTGRDRYAEAAAAKDDPFLDDLYRCHVVRKFPKVRPWLRDHLVKANIQRRQYLRYARQHHDKIAHEPASVADITFSHASSSDTPGIKKGQPKTLVSNRGSIEIGYLGGSMSQSTGENSAGALNVVPLEEFCKDGKPFECPYCRDTVQASRQTDWRQHVLRDIRAWTCTFKDCSHGLFEDRDSWFQHELERHRRQYTCCYCITTPFPFRDVFEHHLSDVHPELSAEILPAIIDSSSHPASEFQASECPLCNDWRRELVRNAWESAVDVVVSPHDFRRHLGHHLEQLALFTIAPESERAFESGSNKSPHNAKDIKDRTVIDANRPLDDKFARTPLVLQDYEPARSGRLFVGSQLPPKREFRSSDKVLYTDQAGGVTQEYKIANGRINDDNNAWEYQLKTLTGQLYAGGLWVPEVSLEAA